MASLRLHGDIDRAARLWCERHAACGVGASKNAVGYRIHVAHSSRGLACGRRAVRVDAASIVRARAKDTFRPVSHSLGTAAVFLSGLLLPRAVCAVLRGGHRDWPRADHRIGRKPSPLLLQPHRFSGRRGARRGVLRDRTGGARCAGCHRAGTGCCGIRSARCGDATSSAR